MIRNCRVFYRERLTRLPGHIGSFKRNRLIHSAPRGLSAYRGEVRDAMRARDRDARTCAALTTGVDSRMRQFPNAGRNLADDFAKLQRIRAGAVAIVPRVSNGRDRPPATPSTAQVCRLRRYGPLKPRRLWSPRYRDTEVGELRLHPKRFGISTRKFYNVANF
jgi:hypothetical protein